MKPKRYRTNKAANMVAVVFALGTASLMTRSTPVIHWTTRPVHATPQTYRSIPQSPLRPDARETITPRPRVRLKQA